MQTYRSLAARLGNAKSGRKRQLDHKLEQLSERISERLAELTDMERLALTGWRAGILEGTYEVDDKELTTKPYKSIRRIDRWTEEYDPADYETTIDEGPSDDSASLLAQFLSRGR